jgi:hypothetical protein
MTMRTDKPGDTVKISDAILSERPAPSVVRAIKTNLAEFNKRKDKLIDHLKGRSPGSEQVDEEKLWHNLTSLAQLHFLRKTSPTTVERKARLRKLAELLHRASNLAERARQDNIGVDLVSALFDGALPRDPPGQIVRDDNGTLRVVHFSNIGFAEMVATLATYQAVALRTADDVPAVPPGKTPILPRSFIIALAEVYRRSTGRKPGAGKGPFARFVVQFRAALDSSQKIADGNVDNSVIDAIKDALRKERTQKKDRKPR